MASVLNTIQYFKGAVAKKTKQIRAKPMINLIVDRSVLGQFLVTTLEGKEPVSPDAMMCVGESNDAWQQTATAMLKKYDVTSIDAEGWIVCSPNADVAVEFFIATADMFRDAESTYVCGAWGETVDGLKNLQKVRPGDAVVRDRSDYTDQWVVNAKIWRNSYTVISPADV